VRRQTLTTSDLDAAQRGVDAWHREVVPPPRGVRQRLRTRPAPAPSDVTVRLCRKVQQIEIGTELIELDQLGALIPVLDPIAASGSATEYAAAAIETVIRTYTHTACHDRDREAIDTIAAAAAQQINPSGHSHGHAIRRVPGGVRKAARPADMTAVLQRVANDANWDECERMPRPTRRTG
jgi:hypothetical protein